MSRIVEVYTGAYASGKSEVSINRALMLSEKNNGNQIIVDMDTVEPAYTLRPLIKELEELGLKVIAQDDYFGLGETGNAIKPEQQNCLLNKKENIVIDVGYGVGGLDILEIIQHIDKEEDLSINLVINTAKLETATPDSILEYVNWYTSKKEGWKQLTGIVSNTHLGDETTMEDVLRGYEITKKAAEKMNLPIVAIGVDETIADKDSIDNVPIWKLKRFMPKALW